MKFLFLSIFFVVAMQTFCVAQYMQIIPRSGGAYDGINSSDMLLLSQNEAGNKNTADVNGNPFWNEEWKTAILYTDDYAIFISRVKLNMYSAEVWYTTPDNRVMIAQKGKVKSIRFFNGTDTSSVLANFFYLKSGDDNNYHYYQFMNTGKAQLVKLTTVSINTAPFDPFTGKAEKKYVTQTELYLLYNSEMTLLKGNNKDALFAILQPDNDSKAWLDKNRNKLKSTTDMLLFLDYFNSKQ